MHILDINYQISGRLAFRFAQYNILFSFRGRCRYFIALQCINLSVPCSENGLFYDHEFFFREGLKKGTKIKGGVQKIKFSSK